MTTIAKRDGFTLYERPDRASPPWRSFKLVGRTGRKRNWWLGWNGERLARNSDTVLLAEHRPEVHAWVLEVLAGLGSEVAS